MNSSELPFVSVIVAAFNAEKTIARCLDALLVLDYPDYEVIVIDNNSTDRTAEIVKKYEVTYLLEEKKGWPAARNTGIEYSKARFIANIDADCFAEKEWLKRLMHGLLVNPSVGGTIGKTKVEEGKKLIERYYAQADPFNFEKHIGKTSYVSWGGGNNAYRKEVFEKAGYYDSERYVSGADIEFHERVAAQSNLTIKYVPGAVIYHSARNSIRELFHVAANVPRVGPWIRD